MKVIIPVAGTGTRLRPHTHSLPKPLLTVAGKEILAHILDPVARLNPEEVALVVGFKGDMIKEYVRSEYQFSSRFVRQEKLLGLGHALHMALEEIDGGPVLIILGDTIVDCDLEAFVSAGDNVLGLHKVEDARRFGVAEVDNNRIVRLEEKPDKPKSHLAVIGLYYFTDSAVLKECLATHVQTGRTTRGEIQFTDALQQMIAAGASFVPFEVQGWYDCGKKETMLETNRHLLAKLPEPSPIDGSELIPPVFLGENVIINQAVLGPNVSVSRDAVINRSVIRNTIIDSGARIDNAVIDNSIIGRGATVRGQELVCNLGESSELNAE